MAHDPKAVKADPILVLARVVRHLAHQAAPGMHDDALDALLLELDPVEKKKAAEAKAEADQKIADKPADKPGPGSGGGSGGSSDSLPGSFTPAPPPPPPPGSNVSQLSPKPF